jgi:hypothetical protein
MIHHDDRIIDQIAHVANGEVSTPQADMPAKPSNPFKSQRDKGTDTHRYPAEARWHLLEVYQSLTYVELRILVNWLEEIGSEQFLDYANHVAQQAIGFLGSSPSQRDKKKFKSEGQRLAFLSAVMFFGCLAVQQLEEQEASGKILGGIGYREMTRQAAMERYLVTADRDFKPVGVFPADLGYINQLDESDTLRRCFANWVSGVSADF